MRAADNPFRSECVLRVRYRFQEITWSKFLAQCEALQYRGALVGPYGSGKTTLLEDLESKFRENGFETRLLRASRECPSFSSMALVRLVSQLDQKVILLFDGAEQIGPLTWYWFKWRAQRLRGLIITTHAPGRLPTLWECRTSVLLLRQIVAELQGPKAGSIHTRSGELFNKHGGNLRDALRDCYDLMSQPGNDFDASLLTLSTNALSLDQPPVARRQSFGPRDVPEISRPAVR